jgi:putative oxidoreductase
LIARLVALAERSRSVLAVLANVLDLGIRWQVAYAFFLGGLTKIRNWDTTLLLFRDEYHVPVLSPETAAVLGAVGELALPPLLALGLASRLAAAGLSAVNLFAVVSYWYVLKDMEAALAQHFYWGLLLLVTLLHGPGKLSLDAIIWPRLTANAG